MTEKILTKKAEMDIKHHESENKGVFYFEKGTDHVAELTYTRAGDKRIIIDHTSVSEGFRGNGLGKALVYFAVEFARRHDLVVLPLCPYAQSVFRRYEELRDVLE